MQQLLTSMQEMKQDFQNESSEVRDNQVILKWAPPPNVRNVTVVRKEGLAPRSIDDGMRLTTSASNSLVDRDVLNEQSYYYGIYSQFNNQGKTLTSSGKVVKARPEAPPTIITELTISNEKLAQGYRVQLTWPQPDKGKAVILKAEQSTQLASGTSISIDQLRQYGQVLEGQTQPLTDTWLQQGICYYTPVVTFGGMAYLGSEVPCACIDEVSSLRGENMGNTIRLRWSWPAGARKTEHAAPPVHAFGSGARI